MRFLANENFPAPSITRLRAVGHDVSSMLEAAPGITDGAVIAIAVREDRCVLTFDKDYGELIFTEGLEDPPAVVFFRHRGPSPEAAAELLQELLAQSTELLGRFTVVEEGGIRQRMY